MSSVDIIEENTSTSDEKLSKETCIKKVWNHKDLNT